MSHISIFLPSLRGGGAERMMVNLVRAFTERGQKVDLVLTKAEGPYLNQVSPKARLVDLGASRVLAGLPALVRYLRRERPEALLSAMDHANVTALWAKRLARVPTRVVVSVRNILSLASVNSPTIRGRWMPYLVRRFYPWAEGIVGISQGVADDLVRTAGLPRERIQVIYNPVLTPQIPSMAAMPLDHPWFAPGEPPVILGAGRLKMEKDFASLIRAFAQLRTQRPVRLVILGEGEERAALEALVKELGIESVVSLPGFVENPFTYMSKATVFVISSVWEGFGNVLVEAMACGTPVVSTDCPSGPSEILEYGRYGPLVPVGDIEALAEAIGLTLENPLDAGTLQRRAGNFSIDNIPDQYLEILHGSR